MNREPNKEIDILLRKLSGKPNGSFKPHDGSSPAGAHEHLDADELNAYAEHALPQSLRARYTEHLADCSRCRNIVTQLSLSTTAIPTREVVTERSPSWLMTFLASVFSPFVVRYAVPAMAVIMIAALAWIVLRRGPAGQEVAQNRPATASQVKSGEQTVTPTPTLGAPSAESTKSETAEEPARGNREAKPFADKRQPEVSADRPATTASASKAGEDEKKADVAAKPDEAAPVTTAPGAATGAAAPPAPKESVTVIDRTENVQKKAEEVKVQSTERRAYDERQRSGPSNTQRAKNQEVDANRSNQPVQALGSVASRRGATGRKDDGTNEDSEVRTIGGHRFAKRGEVWVDSLYNSGRSITNVARGSEQYRSLMGDEPDLRAIVDQLRGEIIIVWKNRAYRVK